MTGFVPRHLRNPRRAYDRDGREIPPATVGHERSQGATTVSAHCSACHHSAIISTDGLPDDFAIPDIAMHLRCSACGSRAITVTADMAAFYARMRERGLSVGGEARLDEGRTVLRPFVRGG